VFIDTAEKWENRLVKKKKSAHTPNLSAHFPIFILSDRFPQSHTQAPLARYFFSVVIFPSNDKTNG
jgi:hypothetical protein